MSSRLFMFLIFCVLLVATVQFTAGIREQRAESSYPARGKIVEVDGVKIHAEIYGEGPDLVLIHGASGNVRDMTLSLVEKLSSDYRVIVVDRPGLGWSDQPPGYGAIWNTTGESPQLQAELLRGAADQLGVSNPLVLGHSFGGAVAMAWALQDPEIAGVIMLAAVSHPWPGDLNWQYGANSSVAGSAVLVPLIAAFAPPGYVEMVIDGLFLPQAAPDGYMNNVGGWLTLRRKTIRANARQVNGLRPHVVAMSEDYPKLTMPIEIVHGDADTIVPLEVHSRPLSERVESANLTVLQGVGHMPHQVAQDAVLAAIDRAATRAGLR